MKKTELIRLIRYQMKSGDYPGTEIVLDLLDVLIRQGGASLGDITKIKELILEE